jgi:uncharacterized damage-inducible protein DinB
MVDAVVSSAASHRNEASAPPASGVLVSLFRYKAWINPQLFARLAQVDPEAHKDERHMALRILNHVYTVDRIFAAHLSGQSHAYTAPNTPETPTLEALRDAVAESDRWYVRYAQSVTARELAEEIAFTFTDGERGRMTREEMLLHICTHGAYHRGGVGRIISQAGVQPPRDIFTTFLHADEPERRA